jgi:hypothetical protein
MSYRAKSMIYRFDELPLVTSAGGVEAGFVNGEAELEYELNGEWIIIHITLEGCSATGPGNKRFWPQVDAPPAVAAIIDKYLNNEWHARVCEAVSEQREQDRVDAREQQADYRRDVRMEF